MERRGSESREREGRKRVGQPRGREGRGVDACMEVNGRVGRGGEIYISKRISTWAGYTTIVSDYVT